MVEGGASSGSGGRPFQLAFILTALESVANPKSKFRKTCDLLWVPTGAGKTEAYLGLIAFALAHRRRLSQKRLGENTELSVSVITRYTLRLLTDGRTSSGTGQPLS